MKTEQRHTYLELCIPYVLGRLNLGNKKQFDAHLQTGCAECTKELSELQEALSLLPLTLQQQMPPNRVKEQLQRIAAGKKIPSEVALAAKAPGEVAPPAQILSKTVQLRLAYGFAIAALLGIVLLGVYTNELHKKIDRRDQEIVKLKGEMERNEKIVKILQAPALGIVELRGTQSCPGCYGRIVFEFGKKEAVIQISGLPIVLQDREYQLWVIQKERPVGISAFSITSEREGESYFKLVQLEPDQIGGPVTYEVTLEPKGGSTEPTGIKYLVGAAETK